MPAANGGRASGSPLSHSNHCKPARRDASAFSVQCAMFTIHRTLDAEHYSALSHDAAQAVPPHDTTVCRPRHPRGHIVRLDHTGPRAAQLTVHAIAAGGRVAALRFGGHGIELLSALASVALEAGGRRLCAPACAPSEPPGLPSPRRRPLHGAVGHGVLHQTAWGRRKVETSRDASPTSPTRVWVK